MAQAIGNMGKLKLAIVEKQTFARRRGIFNVQVAEHTYGARLGQLDEPLAALLP